VEEPNVPRGYTYKVGEIVCPVIASAADRFGTTNALLIVGSRGTTLNEWLTNWLGKQQTCLTCPKQLLCLEQLPPYTVLDSRGFLNAQSRGQKLG
jgi:hypothetical protein